MPQAKKQQFVVTGKNDQHKVGDIVSLEVGDDGLPASELMRSRVKPYRGKVQGGDAEKIIADAKAEAKKILDDASEKAEKIIADTKAEAKKILDDASEKAEKIITDAHAATGKK